MPSPFAGAFAKGRALSSTQGRTPTPNALSRRSTRKCPPQTQQPDQLPHATESSGHTHAWPVPQRHSCLAIKAGQDTERGPKMPMESTIFEFLQYSFLATCIHQPARHALPTILFPIGRYGVNPGECRPRKPMDSTESDLPLFPGPICVSRSTTRDSACRPSAASHHPSMRHPSCSTVVTANAHREAISRPLHGISHQRSPSYASGTIRL